MKNYLLKFKVRELFYMYYELREKSRLKKTILKTLIVVGVAIGIFSVPFFLDTEPEIIAAEIVAR